jgi:hypothetical protein
VPKRPVRLILKDDGHIYNINTYYWAFGIFYRGTKLIFKHNTTPKLFDNNIGN